MKFISFFFLFMAGALLAGAQVRDNRLMYAQKAEKYARMKRTGSFLTISGGIAMIVGVGVLINSTTTTTYYGGGGTNTQTTGNPGLGALLFLYGHAGLGAGIPLWIIGNNNARKYNEKLEGGGLSLGLNLAPQKAGLRLTYTFK